ncbi:helicase-associated domain-containing protein [Microbacterium sp. XT11]|uniref:helicase-associated domain-containing protein n=1 Tax=Microbacterium sp. XT11 TaxID=367477 RepID=UPI000742FE7F|nr:helicase-associated domain-containing protein [Microbacterium sp. XT11]ALX67410.1 hypothetical protein AB663_003344 [Microbacterium sp. XT11]
MTTHARPLAEWLAALSDEQLSDLFRARDVRADAAWHDFFDAAEALLEPSAIARALPALTDTEARALISARDGRGSRDRAADLRAFALLRPDNTPWPEVTAALSDRDAPPPATEAPPHPSDERASAHAAERAFTTVATVADLLLLARDRPFALLTGGTVSAAEKRQLADAGIPADAVDPLLAIATDAGLAVADDRRLRTTADAEPWLRAAVVDRWGVLAQGFRGALPRGVRTSEGGWRPPAAWPDAHPWDVAWHERSTALIERARLLGLIADDGTEPEWAAVLRRGEVPRPSSLAALLPPEVDRIFLQNDLSAIAPGPLAPALDVRLRTLAGRESAAQASSYRFTPESIARALVLGETEQSILDFLGEISLTGIPQPLQYLIGQTAQRHGLVRVSADPATGRTRIESADGTLIDAMSVDQALRPLGLRRDDDALTTKVGSDTAYWALVEARYPATLVDEHGTPLTSDRHPAATPSPRPSTDYTALIASLRSHQGPDADAAWLDRELEAAVRTRALLRVSVGMPDGSTRELLLEATGLGGGRLRGRDRAADVERTLPVSSIRAASIVEQ